jgi:hypothetical protein
VNIRNYISNRAETDGLYNLRSHIGDYKSTFFKDVTPFNLVEVYHCFGGMYYLYLYHFFHAQYTVLELACFACPADSPTQKTEAIHSFKTLLLPDCIASSHKIVLLKIYEDYCLLGCASM